METVRLRTIQQLSFLDRLLHSFMLKADLLPEGAYQIRNCTDLPAVLQPIIVLAAQRGQAWTCWADNVRTWLVTAEMSLVLSREHGSPVLLVDVYRENGNLTDSATWVPDQTSRWRRCHEQAG